MTSQQKPSGLPNPYAGGGLPNPYALPTSAAAAPANSTEEQAKADEKKTTAKLFHNPHLIKRPQAKTANPIKKPVAPKPAMPAIPVATAASTGEQAPQTVKHNIDWYRSTVDDDNAILEAQRESNREKKQTWKDQKKFRNKFGNWNANEPYKLKNSTNIAAYKASGEYDKKNEMFRAYLREARRNAPRSKGDSSSPRPRPQTSSRSPASFETPASVQSTEGEPSAPPQAAHIDITETGEDAYERRLRLAQERSDGLQKPDSPTPAEERMDIDSEPPLPSESDSVNIPPPPPVIDDAKTGEDAFQRRIRLAKERAQQLAASIPPPPPPPPPPPQVTDEVQEADPPPPPASYSATISAPPVRYSATISAAPVHYARPEVEKNVEEPEPQRSERPTKKQKTDTHKPSKAELMMAKMGYKKGQGLGKNSDGIITHLEVKRRKEPKGGRQITDDFEFGDDGSGVKAPKPQQVFDIMGGRQTKPKEQSKWGEPSRVVVAWGCVDDIDFADDADREDGGIRQEMGDQFDAKFGSVERIHVNVNSDDRPVYVAFRDALSALNAVNRFSEGYEFRGRPVKAQFYDEGKFNDFNYEH